jgi:hypothetical protein
LLLLAALGLQAASVRVPLLGRGWVRLDPRACPVELLPELRAYERTRSTGTPIFNDMIFGGYLIYFTPGLRVFIDDRCELYGDEWLLEYAVSVLHHPERIEAWADEYGFEYALVQPATPVEQYLAGAAGWTVAGRTDAAVLYRRNPAGRAGAVKPPRRAGA